MNIIKKILEFILSGVLLIVLIGGYLFGMYSLFTNDDRSTKELIGGMAIPPYAIYVGVVDGYDALTGDSSDIPDKDFIIKIEKRPLVDFVSFLNRSINPPVMSDEMTKLLSITTDGNNIIFTNMIVGQEVTEDLKTMMRGMFVAMKIKYCNDKQYEEYDHRIIERNIGMTIEYLDKNNVDIGKVNLNKTICEHEKN